MEVGSDPSPKDPTRAFRREGLQGVVIGAALFAFGSILAPSLWHPLARSACALAGGEHFPSAACLVGESVTAALRLGPAVPFFLLVWPGVKPLTIIPATSALMIAIASGVLRVRFGRARGSVMLVGLSLIAIACLSLFLALQMNFAQAFEP